MTVESSVLVQFGNIDQDSVLALAEKDPIKNVDSSGNAKTKFYSQDDIYYIYQLSNNIDLDEIVSTAGTIQVIGSVERTRVQYLDFGSREEENEYVLEAIPVGGLTIEYIGKGSVGDVTSSQNGNRTTSVFLSSAKAPVKAKITYQYQAISFRLRVPILDLEADETYPITTYLYLNQEEITDECNS